MGDAGATVMPVPTGRSLLPADRAPWHPLARLGAFVAAVAVASLVAQAVVYPLVAAGFEAFGVRPLVAEWLTLAGALGGSWLAVRAGEPERTMVPARLALAAPAWRWAAVVRGTWGGAWPMTLTLAALLAVGAYGVERTEASALLATTGRALMVLVPAAAAEEVLVRGFGFTVLAEWVGDGAAIGVTSLCFAALHLLNPGVGAAAVINVALAGVLLALVRVRTGSLVAAIGAHLAWNALVVVVAHAPVSGLAFPTPGWRLVPLGPTWLTGGAWGPEGSVVATAALVVACAVWWRGRSFSESSSARLGASVTS